MNLHQQRVQEALHFFDNKDTFLGLEHADLQRSN